MSKYLCNKCDQEKPEDDFYFVKGKMKKPCKDCVNLYKRSHHHKVKDVHNKRMRNHYRDNKEYYQKKSARYRYTDNGKEVLNRAAEKFKASDNGKKSSKVSQKKYSENNVEKSRAHWAVQSAIRSGALVREPCEKCGTELDIHAHHDDYSKRLDVRWLCRAHHSEHHRVIIL